MKRLYVLLTVMGIVMVSFKALGQTKSKALADARDLITQQKYETAFQLLNRFDPSNKEPDLVLLKEQIALNYFVTSIMHFMFSFKDLKPGENLMDYRGKQGTSKLYVFPIDKILDSLIEKHPNNCRLYKVLGGFYYEVHLKYSSNWIKPEKEVLDLIGQNDGKAIQDGCADYLTYYTMGYVSILQKQYKEGIPYFLKSISLHTGYADSYYNLAYAYLFSNDRNRALEYAKQSYRLYSDSVYKSDAARMLGEIYMECKGGR